jgi:hypothetical protein
MEEIKNEVEKGQTFLHLILFFSLLPQARRLWRPQRHSFLFARSATVFHVGDGVFCRRPELTARSNLSQEFAKADARKGVLSTFH